MCGRYSLALRPSQVRAYLENEHMPVYESPDDDGEDAPRQSYNFAPGYHGIVYRADTPDWGSGPRHHDANEPEQEEEQQEIRYKLQSMKWGLIPFWTKRNPDYGSLMKTINCRDDSLIDNKGMWTSMKHKKRCIVIAQGFYEWLKKGKDKIPHYVKRKDGQLMCVAGLWDCVQYEGSDEKTYTYTVITTSSNKQLNFLHDRMPVILENGSEEITTWLDPKRSTWSKELQSLLRPFEGELEIYPVPKEVGKVGNNSETFIVPISSTQNKSNIANFFSKAGAKGDSKPTDKVEPADSATSASKEKDLSTQIKSEEGESSTILDHDTSEDNEAVPVPKLEANQGIKRELEQPMAEQTPRKILKTSTSPSKTLPSSKAKTKNAMKNTSTSPKKSTNKEKGSQKITSFFSK